MGDVTQASLPERGYEQTPEPCPPGPKAEDDPRQRMDRLDLLPGGGAPSRQIAAGPVLGHHAFLAPPHRFLEKDPTSSFHARLPRERVMERELPDSLLERLARIEAALE